MVTTAAAGRILPKVDMKWFLSLNVLLLAGASFGMSLANSLVWLLLGSALIGFAAGFGLYAIVPIVLNQWFLEPTRYVSIATAVGGAGGILFCPIITAAISNLGWRGAYRMVGCVVLAVMLPLALFVIRYSPEKYGLKPYGNGKEKAAQKTREEGFFGDAKKTSRMYIYFLLFFISAAVLSGMYGHVASAFWAKGFSDSQVGMLTSAYQFGTTVIQLLFGLISMKLGLQKTLNLLLPLVVVACGGLILVDQTMAGLTAVFAVMLGIGRSFGVINPLMTRYVFGSKTFTTVYSDLYSVFLIGTAATATVFGGIYNATGSYDSVYLLVIVCTIVELVLVQLIFRDIKGRKDEEND
jgi:MFS family permease